MTQSTDRPKSMDQIVALCKRRGFIFQSSEIYGGLNGFWDYGPLGAELKRNVRNAWYNDMVTNHDEFSVPPGAPRAFSMVGIESSLIMHPQVWKCSGHFDMFVDMMVDCKECKARFRADHVSTSECPLKPSRHPGEFEKCKLTEPREFNLMFKTIIGALSGEEGAAFLRPETAQGMFVNFKNVCDSTRVKIPFGIAQVGKSFRNEITPRNFTFRSREFEQMEMEFFCHPSESRAWYQYWRDRRYNWYINLGISKEHLRLRDHTPDELSHYSCGTADVEYTYPFLGPGDFGELEGVAHRGDFDLRSHMEGKLVHEGEGLAVEKDPQGNPRHRGSGKDLSYFDDQTRERYIPHVIEPAAGADRGTLAFLCEAYQEDVQPDEKGEMQERVVLRFHPKLAPIKVAVFPLIKKEGMPEVALAIYRELREAGIASYFDQQAAIGRRYRRQDEVGTPYCLTIDGETAKDNTVTIRDRDTLAQERIPIKGIVEEIQRRLRG
jgi:glycyl-tRNA synthetase